MCFVRLLLVAKGILLFSGLGLYSGIFALYLQCASKTPRTATIAFCALCLLYILSTVTYVADLVKFILEELLLVSNHSSSICKNIIFYYQLCSSTSVHHHFNFKLSHGYRYFALRLFKPQQAVVVISSHNVS